MFVNKRRTQMRSFSCLVVLIVMALLSVSGCNIGLPIEAGIAVYEWRGMSFTFNVGDGTLIVTNKAPEYQDGCVKQRWSSTGDWYNLQGRPNDYFRLAGSTQRIGRKEIVFYGVPYDKGRTFSLSVRKQGQDWETIWVDLLSTNFNGLWVVEVRKEDL